MLRLVLPKGSLERATMQLFEDADLAVNRASDVAYRATIADPRISEVRILRPQEIPVYVADGLFDLGITGHNSIEERGSEVVSLGKLGLLQGDLEPGPDRAHGGRLPGAQSGRPGLRDGPGQRRLHGQHRVPRTDAPGPQAHRIEADIADILGRHRGQGARHRRRGGGHHRDRQRAPRPGLRVIETLLVSRAEPIANAKSAADPEEAPRHGADPDPPPRARSRRGARCS